MICRYIFDIIAAVMAILCILKRMSNAVKSVCNCGPTINLSLRETSVVVLDQLKIKYNTQFVTTFIGNWVIWKIETVIGWNIYLIFRN
ncbi:hypothetical protein CEXT_295441 [Caerostris extrusa]|uniref:Uncharacterized protein n=1 Tax=Caerostris extrusa TaxID=172846 RepID=A0AAV4RC52_CAEEX|nr:hypothetical protein CEXT_295441 [Caerostris extrusa]